MLRKKRITVVWVHILLSFAPLLLLGSTIGRATVDTDFLFGKAAEYRASGKYLEAMGLYQAVADNAASVSERARAMLMLGAGYQRYLDQPDTALKYFDYVLKHYPSTRAAGEAFFNKGMVLYQKHRYGRAYEIFSRYPAEYPDGKHIASARSWAQSALSLAAAGVSQTSPTESHKQVSDRMIRVLIAEECKKVSISAESALFMKQRPSRGLLEPGSAHRVDLIASEGRMYWTGKGKTIPVSPPLFIKSSGLALALDDTCYRGFFKIGIAEGRLWVVNYVDIEAYLYGVVPKEMPCHWPDQALMAQAVAARTYALNIKQKRRDEAYDVKATTASQVYGGLMAERDATRRAVDKTRGQVLTYQGSLIVAYYHANSGGYTECPENVWGADVPYLKAHPDRYSTGAPGSRWRYFLPYEEGGRRLRDYGIDPVDIKKVEFGAKTESGRVREIIIDSGDGRAQRISGNNFRLAIGGTKLKSTCFKPQFKKEGILFKGSGYGHGVGMSQWGARRMALEGHDYKHILHQYYKGVKIASVFP